MEKLHRRFFPYMSHFMPIFSNIYEKALASGLAKVFTVELITETVPAIFSLYASLYADFSNIYEKTLASGLAKVFIVELMAGIEPATSSLPRMRSTI